MRIKLGDISPLAGMVTGEGLMGTIARAGGLGVIGKLAAPDPEKNAREASDKAAAVKAAKMAAAGAGPAGMKRGGKVSSSSPKKMAKSGSVNSRSDGCAQRGKTKGRFV